MNSNQIRNKIAAFNVEVTRLKSEREGLLEKIANADDERADYDNRRLSVIGNEILDREAILERLQGLLSAALVNEETEARETLISEIVGAGKQSIDEIKKAIKPALAGLKAYSLLLKVIAQEGEKYHAIKAKLPVDANDDFDAVQDLIGGRIYQRLINFDSGKIEEFLESLYTECKIDFTAQAEALRSANEEFRLGPAREKAADEARENERAAWEEEQVEKHRVIIVKPQEA